MTKTVPKSALPTTTVSSKKAFCRAERKSTGMSAEVEQQETWDTYDGGWESGRGQFGE